VPMSAAQKVLDMQVRERHTCVLYHPMNLHSGFGYLVCGQRRLVIMHL
jgi:hypothetical protein